MKDFTCMCMVSACVQTYKCSSMFIGIVIEILQTVYYGPSLLLMILQKLTQNQMKSYVIFSPEKYVKHNLQNSK